ncbi:CaiB/BaiF CoA transferase family protein [Brevibacterium luteolum]|uniref:CaiB/BaiF CoA transferase family protein n=1 Tax=Brevibacterium luteolum TaxID=199591 RepID=UPI00223B2882|nr:CoA transferase [Brevibacterium luteolum]MCT1658154.1 CoA transferase [Brevibacterium luteolum]
MHSNEALSDLRVVDASTLFAGPMAAKLLGDMGADVIKVEHTKRPDASRGHGPAKDGHGIWWKVLGRNKRTVALDLHTSGGKEAFLRLASTADILIENFRPGTLDRWGLTYANLSRENPGLVVVRITGFGQFGPRSKEPGFGTLAEAMSGFASMTGQPDGPPTLPPLALADAITGVGAAYAAMVALHHRSRSGKGQEVDISLIEPMLAMLGPQITVFDQLGTVPVRHGNRSANNAPRNLYKTKDDRWLAVSTSSQSIAERVMHLVGRPELTKEPWFASGTDRAKHADELDEAVSKWVINKRADEALQEFKKAQAAAALVYDIRDIFEDEQYNALGTIIQLDDPDLGNLKMQNVMFRMSESPGSIRWAGRRHGENTHDILTEIGYSEAEIAEMIENGDAR